MVTATFQFIASVYASWGREASSLKQLGSSCMRVRCVRRAKTFSAHRENARTDLRRESYAFFLQACALAKCVSSRLLLHTKSMMIHNMLRRSFDFGIARPVQHQITNNSNLVNRMLFWPLYLHPQLTYFCLNPSVELLQNKNTGFHQNGRPRICKPMKELRHRQGT